MGFAHKDVPSVMVEIVPKEKLLKGCQRYTPKDAFDEFEKYMLACKTAEQMVNLDFKIGDTAYHVEGLVTASAFLNNNHHADPETRPE